MEVLATTLAWLALGLPVGIVFLRHGRIELCLGVLPFAGSLALLLPVIAAAWTGSGLDGQGWKSLISACALGVMTHYLAGPAMTERLAPSRTKMTLLVSALLPIVAVGLFNVYVGLMLSDGYPTYSWDGYQIWLLHAKILAASPVFPVDFYSEPQLTRSQWQYPLLLPATLAWFMKNGALGIQELHLPIGIIVAVVPIATFLILMRRMSPILASALALVPLSVRGLLVSHHEALADPLLVLVSMAGYAAGITGALRNDRPLMAVGGLALASAVALKNDGIFWVAACASSVGLLGLHFRYSIAQWIRTASTLLIPSVILFVSWDLTCRRLGIVNSVALDSSEFFTRLPLIVQSIVSVLWGGANIAIIPGCIAAVPMLLPGSVAARIRTSLILLALPLVYLTCVVAIQALIYIPPPYDIHWLLFTSIQRLTYGVVPALFFSAVAAATVRAMTTRDG